MRGRREWFIRVPWGKLALVGYGHPDGYPVFLVHGRQDSSSVFEPLIEQMTGGYNFVALDMPGNGLSDAFPPVLTRALRGSEPNYAVMFNRPPYFKNAFLDFVRYTQGLQYTECTPRSGPKLMRFHFLAAMELAIKHLGWDRFIFIGHSMGCEQGLFYSVIHPGQISTMILLDAGPTLMRMQVEDHVEYQRYYDSYYEDYVWENFERRPYVREMALQALERHRELTRNQSEIIIARNFHGFPFYNKQKSNKKLNEDEEQNAKANGTRNTNEKNSQESPKTTGNENTNGTRNTNDQTAEEALKSNGNENTNGTQNTNDQTAEDAPKSSGNKNTNETQNAEPEHSANVAPNPPAPGDLSGFIERMRENDEVGYLSWDNRLKNLAPQNYGNDYYFALFKTIPPTLLIAASDGAKKLPPKWRQGVKELLDRMATLDNFNRVDVQGGHDVHFTHPERVLPYINAFLKDSKVFSKL